MVLQLWGISLCFYGCREFRRVANVGAVAGAQALPAVPGGEGFFGRVRVRNILRDLRLETIQNIGEGNCFAWAVEDASSRNILAEIVRPRARDFIDDNPHHPYVACLSDEESAAIDEDGIDITDQQAQFCVLCFKLISYFWMFQVLPPVW